MVSREDDYWSLVIVSLSLSFLVTCVFFLIGGFFLFIYGGYIYFIQGINNGLQFRVYWMSFLTWISVMIWGLSYIVFLIIFSKEITSGEDQ